MGSLTFETIVPFSPYQTQLSLGSSVSQLTVTLVSVISVTDTFVITGGVVSGSSWVVNCIIVLLAELPLVSVELTRKKYVV